ncbi:hypothetical protein BG015_002739 [Linnemannia schmuckeri]|uniref:Cytochrome b5 heme-binding domain-containing protein n=1 Tax=Linnemannia schmuckeri TaxID=64567 RepID=A0A9P5RQ22_9FUNG|nr:hypothetical protein BG015_002739 [Linnemannia schmuckeri]
MSLGVPTLIAGLGWGDYWGGFIYGGIVRQFVVHHATFCVNSLAHWLGDMPFDDRHTPRDHILTALVTLGEGYHNFHHEFPQDYRNAIKFYQYDPTKWLIAFCAFLGLASDLKRFPTNEIKKGQVRMQQQKLDRIKATLIWGTPIDQLPVYTFEEFQAMATEKGQAVTLIEGIIYDLESFVDEHPGGRSLIRSAIGKDATTSFNGGVYDHSNAARHLLERMRVGVVAGGGYVEHRRSTTAAAHGVSTIPANSYPPAASVSAVNRTPKVFHRQELRGSVNRQTGFKTFSGSGKNDGLQHNFKGSPSLLSGGTKRRRASRVTKFSKTIVPMMDRVLVQRIKPQQKTASGIYIPEKAQETLNEGHVIAVGKGLVTQEGKVIPSELKEGDKVLLPPYGGSAVKVDNEELILFRESEILAKIQ